MAVFYVDECKAAGYLLVATMIQNHDGPRIRKFLKAQVKKGQRSTHFSRENPGRKKQILADYEKLPFQCFVFHQREKPTFEARAKCLTDLFETAVRVGVGLVVIERDDSIFVLERKFLLELIKARGWQDRVAFEHNRRHEEPLLWISDSLAWCIGKSGEWNRSLSNLNITRDA